jgi:hypothetical protein
MRRNAVRTIQLYIDRLILDGLPIDRLQAPYVQAAVEVELTRMLVENGLGSNLQAGGARPNVRTSAIQITPNSNPAHMGTQIAKSVYSGMSEKR